METAAETTGETIIIRREDHERLIQSAEDLADLKAVLRAQAAPEDGFPQDVVMRLINGETPLKVFRQWRGHSGAELARRSGVNAVQINDIEHGRRTGSVETLRKLATALDVLVDDLIA